MSRLADDSICPICSAQKVDNLLESRRVDFEARNRGWNRFYRISVRTHKGVTV